MKRMSLRGGVAIVLAAGIAGAQEPQGPTGARVIYRQDFEMAGALDNFENARWSDEGALGSAGAMKVETKDAAERFLRWNYDEEITIAFAYRVQGIGVAYFQAFGSQAGNVHAEIPTDSPGEWKSFSCKAVTLGGWRGESATAGELLRNIQFVVGEIDSQATDAGLLVDNIVLFSGEDSTPPQTGPIHLSASPQIDETIQLSWGQANDDIGVYRYDVYRSNSAGFEPSVDNRIATVCATQYRDTTAASGERCFYRVVAVDLGGHEAVSDEVACR